VCRFLNERRLVTTSLSVAPPDYLPVEIAATLRIYDDASLKTVKEQIEADLTGFLHPVTGGDEGTGWPFGGTIYYSQLFARLMSIDRVRFVERITITATESHSTTGNPAADRQFATYTDAARFRDDLTRQREAADHDCLPDSEVATITVPPTSTIRDATTAYIVQSHYDCCDVLLKPNQLVGLQRLDITVDYAVGRRTR
jgi:hypothetical protein